MGFASASAKVMLEVGAGGFSTEMRAGKSSWTIFLFSPHIFSGISSSSLSSLSALNALCIIRLMPRSETTEADEARLLRKRNGLGLTTSLWPYCSAAVLAEQCEMVCPRLRQYLHSVAKRTGHVIALFGSALARSA